MKKRKPESQFAYIDQRREVERFLAELEDKQNQDVLRLRRCGSTAAAERALDQACADIQIADTLGRDAERARRNLRLAEQHLDKCRERDRAQADRPDGCTCLGTGFRADKQAPCVCSEGEAVQRRVDDYRRQLQVDAANHRVALFRESVGRRLADFTLDSFPASNAVGRRLVASIRERVADERRPSFWLTGPNGVGKSGLAKAIAEELIAMGAAEEARYLVVPDLLHQLKGTYDNGGSEYEVIEAYRGADVLVLDDLGAERQTDSGWAAERLFLVVNHRYDEMLQTIVTSNQTPQQLGVHLGGQGPRIVWRLLEMCEHQVLSLVDMPNLRAQKHRPSLEVVNG